MPEAAKKHTDMNAPGHSQQDQQGPSPGELAPRPATPAATGLSVPFLTDLISKHLAEAGVLDLGSLARRLGLAGTLIEELVAVLRAAGRVEVLGIQGGSPFLRFGLTERGRGAAAEALLRDGYVGLAPVPLADYERVVRAQSRRLRPLTRDAVHAAFADTVIRPALLDRLGPAVNSGRPLFVYGPSGTGKSFIARRLNRLLGEPVLVPYAIAVGESTVRCLDPGVHHNLGPALESTPTNALMLQQGFDGRYALCERPTVIAGGELTLDMLDLHYDSAVRLYRAPLQLRANNGLLLLDDLGRQRTSPAALFNRWIVPLEEGLDHLSLKGGQHFTVPFDLVLVFSTNLDPRALADDAFLRRIGYKVAFEPSTREEYAAIFKQACETNGVAWDPTLASLLIDELHAHHGIPLLPCHPRDLLGLALDYKRYTMGTDTIDETALRWAWANYFVAPGSAEA
ncbi:AAA family ATPase [uncultured Thiodictyon sp.]|jgi:type II secretory pathway predicted ATPase ExeA|uniref:AAA family ATPase n=1 Tax=uncultured Thiodictyon sp. TaxID=1846217 RepID=UPI0025E3B5DB|nr:AAA family ATPase [uncultured Thiodictyon sp.]